MIQLVFDIIANVIDIILVTFFITKWLGYKNEKHQKIIMLFIALVPIISGIVVEALYSINIIAVISYMIFLFICSEVFLNGGTLEILLVTVLSVALLLIVSMLTLSFTAMILRNNFNTVIFQRGIGHYFILFTTKFLYFLIIFFTLNLKNKIRVNLKWKEWLVIIGIFLSSFIAEIIIFNSYETGLNDNQSTLLFATIGLAVLNIATFYLFTILNKEHNKEKQLEMLNVKLSEQSKSLYEINELSLEMKKIRHDISKYLEVATELLHEGKTEKAFIYINELKTGKIDNIFKTITTTSDVVNSVLNLKYAVCRKKSIRFTYQITGDFSEYSEIDISILLENLLDNAIESSEKSDNPFINITITNSKAYLVIIVRNSVKSSVLLNNPNLVTDKPDKNIHGLGFQTIMDIVNKYNGMINLSENETKDNFIVDIRLKR